MKNSTKNQAQGTIRKVVGRLKELVGKGGMDAELEDEGKAEKRIGKVQQKLGDVEKVVGK